MILLSVDCVFLQYDNVAHVDLVVVIVGYC